ncbi:helix-turn-helix domain-containing protein [Scytonema tolypothrichoides VB-61278]|nr:helix-turn-helix domain-containing protein [Scytonema tolypothrichoides VB-61278]
MQENKFLTVDPTKQKELKQVIPQTPVFFTKQALWHKVRVAHYQLPPSESPEHTFSTHMISIHVGNSAFVERVVDNHVQGEHFVDGDIICINPALLQRVMRSPHPAQFFHLYLEPNFLSHIAHESVNPERVELLPQFKLHDPLIQQIALALKSEAESGVEADSLYIEAAAMMLSAHLLRRYASRKSSFQDYTDGLSKRKLREVLDYINNNLDRELTITELAELVQMSYYYFIRLFKQSTGLTPHCYIVQQRLELAKQLLHSTDLSILEIAYRVGFSCQSRFATVFHQYLKISPRQYRQQIK